MLSKYPRRRRRPDRWDAAAVAGLMVGLLFVVGFVITAALASPLIAILVVLPLPAWLWAYGRYLDALRNAMRRRGEW